MRTRILTLAIAAAASMSPVLAQAPVEIQQQALESNHHLVFFGDGQADSTAYASLISRFYLDQFRHAQDPRAPYFMLMSRNGKMAMGIGGTIEGLAYYDWHGSIPGTDFSPYEISIPMDPSAVNRFQTSMGQSSIFFSVFGKDDRFGDYQLYIQAKFSGPGNSFVLKKAYATVGDWTLGYATSTFVDPSSQPSTVETDGPNSETGGTRFLVRYMHDFGKCFKAAVSVENPDDQVANTSTAELGSVYMPNFAAFVQVGQGSQHLRLSGVLKSMRYRDLVAHQNRYVTGWGANLSTVFRPVAPLTVMAAANTGQGISSMINDLSCGALDLIGYDDKPGHMYAPLSYGWYAALQYNFRPDLFSTVMFSQERMLPKHDADYGPDQYKYGLYATANVFWNITPRCQVGAEINVGKRVNMDRVGRLAYRAGMLAQFSF